MLPYDATRMPRHGSRIDKAQKGHYPPANHHATHLQKCPIPDHNHLLTTGVDDPTLLFYHLSVSEDAN